MLNLTVFLVKSNIQKLCHISQRNIDMKFAPETRHKICNVQTSKSNKNDVITVNYDVIFRFPNFIGLSVFWKPDSGRIPHKPLSFIVLDLLSRYLSSEVLKSILSRNFFIFYFTSKFSLILSKTIFLLKLVFPFFFSSRFL